MHMANKATTKQFEIKGNEIVVRYQIQPTKSKAGKSMVIASSRGRDTFQHDGKNVHVNFNAYVMIDEWEAAGK